MNGERITVSCRAARAEDTPAALELSSHIWEGEDYIPQVWEDWLADTHGRLLVAEHQGRLVGFSKLTLLTPPDRWWLEGLRVHPEFEGHGVARQLHDEQVRYWQEQQGMTLGLATSVKRLPVQHLSEHTGFQRVGEFTYYGAPALEGDGAGFTPLRVEETREAVAFAQESETLSLSYGMMDLYWSWTEPAEVHIQAAVESGQAWWWRRGGDRREQAEGREGLLVIHTDPEVEEHLPSISLAACRMSDLPALLADYRKLAGELGFSRAQWAAPLQPELEPVLREAGFEREWDSAVILYERRQGAG